MKKSNLTEKSKTLNLKNFDIVILNYIEDSQKDELLKELKELYGEYEPCKTGVGTLVGESSVASPDIRFGKRIVYYDDVGSLRKPLPDKFSSLEIRIVNHIASWNEVICVGRVKQEHLDKAKEEFLERIEKDNTVTTPKIFEEAHKELEDYLAQHIMDNLIYKYEQEKRRSYPYLYVGEVGDLPSKKLTEIIQATDYTRYGMGWFIVRWASIFGRHYLIERVGGLGFSILDIAPTQARKEPESWDKEARRRFRAIGYEHVMMMGNISSILLSNVVLSYRLEGIKSWEQKNSSLAGKMQELSEKPNLEKKEKEYLIKTANLQNEVVKLRARFLGESLNLRKESEELSILTKASAEYLSSRDMENAQIEEPFFNPIDEEKWRIDYYVRSGNPKRGVLLRTVEDSQSKNEQLLKRLDKIDEQQLAMTSYLHDTTSVSVQRSMGKSTKRIELLTFAIFFLAIIQALIIVYQFTLAPKP